jgi:hypothetical protein
LQPSYFAAIGMFRQNLKNTCSSDRYVRAIATPS